MAYDGKIFISYSSKDSEFVEKILNILERAQIEYWKAPEMIPAGSNYAKEIPKAIQACEACLFVVSKDSQESIWVEKEIDSMINFRKHLIPIKIDDEPLNDMYKFYLNNVQMIIHDGDITRLENKIIKHIGIAFSSQGKAAGVKVFHRDEEEERLKEQIRRSNLFTQNKAPVECEFCHGAVKESTKGVYKCVKCGKENYDYYETIRRFLRQNGASNALTIERYTKVPRKAIDYFLEQEYLEIPRHDTARLSCNSCGSPIRMGTLCDYCKKRR